MTDQIMMALALNYLEQVDRLDRNFEGLEDLLSHTVKVYNERKQQGLEQ